jgi:hypothetical protein
VPQVFKVLQALMVPREPLEQELPVLLVLTGATGPQMVLPEPQVQV